MDMTTEMEEIDNWVESVNEALSKDSEWKDLNQKVINDSSFNQDAVMIVIRLLQSHIPLKYKQRELAPKTFRFYTTKDSADNNQFGQNSALDDLIDKFDLEVVDAPF